MMIAPFSLDTYLPAFPHLARSLGTTTQEVSLSVSAYIFALAFGQLVGGAMSDRFGRKPILLLGLAVFSAASFALATLETLGPFLALRAVQALGAGWALVSVPAMVRDRVSGLAAAKLFSLMGLILVVAPGIAPSVGSALLLVGPWNLIFVALGVYGLALIPILQMVAFAGARTPVTPPDRLRTSVWQGYLTVLRQRAALPFIAWQTGAFSSMLVFVTNASFLYQEHFGQSEQAFSLLFAVNIVTMFTLNLTNRALLSRLGSLTILRLATGLQGVGVLLVLAASVWDWPLVLSVPSMAMAVGAMGAISPNVQACYMEHFPTQGGTAAALLGATPFFVAGVVTGLASLLPHTPTMVALTMACCSSVAVAMMLRSLRGRGGRLRSGGAECRTDATACASVRVEQ